MNPRRAFLPGTRNQWCVYPGLSVPVIAFKCRQGPHTETEQEDRGWLSCK